MNNPDPHSIPQDAQGHYRSSKLPALKTETIQLVSKVEEPGSVEKWQEYMADPCRLIVLDLFCGAGGMSLGFENAVEEKGFFVAAGIDHNNWAAMSHGYNFLARSETYDIRQINDPQEFIKQLGISRVDVIIGGPPCQGYARVGRGKLRSIDLEKHYQDVLNSLYLEFIRFVEALQPLAFVMENVPDMATYEDGVLLKRIKEAFPGYKTDHCVLNAVDYGVPQRRKRLFIQGNRLGKPVIWPAPQILVKPTSVREAINDLPVRYPPSADEVLPYHATELSAYQQRMRSRVPEEHVNQVFDHVIAQVRDDDKIIFAMLEEGQKYRDIPDEWRRYRSDIFKDKYRKLIYDEPAWTITAHIRKDTYRYIHPDREQGRTLSIREFARLQSFPDDFRFAGPRTARLRQIGNAVPPLLACAIATELHAQIRDWEHTQNRGLDIYGIS